MALTRSRLSVSRMVAAALVAVMTLLLGTYGALRYVTERDREWARLRNELDVETKQLAVSLSGPVWNIDRGQIGAIVQALEGTPAIYAVVVDGAGTRRVRIRDARWRFVAAEAVPRLPELLEERQPILFEGRAIGSVHVYSTPRFVEASLRTSLLAIVATIIVIDILLTFFTYLALWRLVLSPLVRIEKYATAVRDGADARAPEEAGSRELESVRSSIETMVGLLGARYAELRASEERFRTIFDVVSDAISIHDLETGEFLDLNARMCTMFGYTRDEIRRLGIPGLSSGIPPYTEEEAMKRVARAANGEAQLFEWQTRHADGHLFWTEVSVQAATISGVARMLVVTRDITQRKKMQDELRAEKEFMDTAIDAIPGLFFVQTRDGGFVRWNDALEGMYGPDGPPPPGRNRRELVHPADRARTQAAIDRAFATGSAQLEARLVYGDPPEARHFFFTGRRMERQGEQFLVATAMDITERYRAEEERGRLQNEIARSAIEWQQTFDSVETPIIMVERDGTVIRCNRAVRELSGKSREELTGRVLDEICAHEPWKTAAALARARGADSAATKDDHGRSWQITLARFGASEGGGERFILVLWDTTRIVDLQESLRRSETMSAMGSLVGGVAHEVRNPLFGISATLDAYSEELSQPAFHDFANTLRREVTRLIRLMQELLDYGRPPALELAPERLDGIIAEAVERSTIDARPAKVEIRNRVHGTPPLPIDRSRMRQVFDNLLDNARQHAPAGGWVEVSCDVIDYAGRRWLETRVDDNGPGFTAKALPRVFEPFFTLRNDGTGLGLSIVQRIVQEHGGTVTASNRPGGGARITVRLPLEPAGATMETVGVHV